ncbi:YdcF family protein [Corynebacterium uberis]|uniref:YdcF family protein n=1 Tax=Corynebacterium TaxID=1716 RepID=UPI001D0BE55A|nr:YdcF family protein [Corynebacterium uberis]MCZ9309247.1 YdcF family protein [Corynebacterium sp. c6VSa_13]UDL72803.1 YdcF family protein [Corynebacterium uberis]UDL76320.1 YdcF family protein [Corynebacterium uberis]UDL78532.1 YdcF family protein [Corynebacterium uberis]UDL80813.1 YdcF family protein [Corynebacterium uberis]
MTAATPRRAVLVLGSRVRRGNVDELLASRLRTALELIRREGPDAGPVVVSGAGEAPAMARWLRAHGVPAERIVIEPAARSTNENLENAHALLPEVTSWTVVSSRFHLWRTRAWAWHLGLAVTAVGAPTPPGQLPRLLLREGAALAHSAARMAFRRAVAVVRWRAGQRR